jgi:hypothetical protein
VSLKIVNISDLTAWCTIDFLGPNSNPLCYAKCLYLNDKLVTDLVIPDGVTKINRYAFYSAECLSSITICNPLITIGKDAFYGCSNLGDVRISDLAAWCNIDFSNLESNPLAYAKLLYLNNELVTNLVIPNTVSKIKSYSFYNCKCLTSVIIPNTVTSLDNKAFYGCSGLTSVTIPNSVISIGESTFRDCTELTSVTIPNSVTSIGSSAFKGCLDRG